MHGEYAVKGIVQDETVLFILTRYIGPYIMDEGFMSGDLRKAAVIGASLLGGLWLIPADAIANQGTVDLNTPPATDAAMQVAPPATGAAAYFDDWFARVTEAQAAQPHWMTPVVTVTPRLEQEVRYDQYWEHQGTGATLDIFDSGKGLELIPSTTNEIIINAPAYEERTVKKPASGFLDWPFLLVKQRLISAPEESGNYILSAFFAVQAPTGSSAFTQNAWLLTPTIAAGKGFGDFDVQATFGVPLPTAHEDTIGIPLNTNVALQYHIADYFWPEVELNDTYWTSGERVGKNQLFLTPGVVLGRFQIAGRVKAIIGGGYQVALTPKFVPDPTTPTYNHSWILTTRISF